MSRKLNAARTLFFASLVVGYGCSLGGGNSAQQPETTLNAASPNYQVVSGQDAQPRLPEYSPLHVDHGTLSPYESPTPSPSPLPTVTPTQAATAAAPATAAVTPSPAASTK